jgi:hypothetical protein
MQGWSQAYHALPRFVRDGFVHSVRPQGRLLLHQVRLRTIFLFFGSFFFFFFLADLALLVRDEVLADKIPKCPKCRIDKNVMKPDIVFFNEPLSKKYSPPGFLGVELVDPKALPIPRFDLSLDKDLDKVDLLVVMGSSLRVQPVSIIPGSSLATASRWRHNS